MLLPPHTAKPFSFPAMDVLPVGGDALRFPELRKRPECGRLGGKLPDHFHAIPAMPTTLFDGAGWACVARALLSSTQANYVNFVMISSRDFLT